MHTVNICRSGPGILFRQPYKPWSDEALAWLIENAHELRIDEYVGLNDQYLNLCPECAKDISDKLWELPDSSKACPPPFDLYPTEDAANSV